MAKPVKRKSAPPPPKPVIRVDWELILKWREASDKPFVWQKLGFKAGPLFKHGSTEALKIRALLINVGNYEQADVRLVAVTQRGVLDKHNAEKGVFIRAHKTDIAKVIDDAKKINKPKRPLDRKVLRTRGG